MDKELQNLLDNYEQAIYGYTEPIIPSIHQIHLLLDYISRLNIQVKKQKEVIDKLSEIIYEINDLKETTGGYPSYYVDDLVNILKEVSE